MNNMQLVVDYISIDNDIYLDIKNGNKKIGEIEIMNDMDCYAVSIESYADFHIAFHNKMDSAIDFLFGLIYSYMQSTSCIDPFSKQVLLVEDENIASRYAINHNLKRVPRYNGFYLF